MRGRLIWFALGAAASSLAFVLTSMLNQPLATTVPVLVLEENLTPLFEMSNREVSMTAPLNGKLLHECGARAFEMDNLVPDGGAQARVAITAKNRGAINCVLQRASNEGFALTVSYMPVPRVARHEVVQ